MEYDRIHFMKYIDEPPVFISFCQNYPTRVLNINVGIKNNLFHYFHSLLSNMPTDEKKVETNLPDVVGLLNIDLEKLERPVQIEKPLLFKKKKQYFGVELDNTYEDRVYLSISSGVNKDIHQSFSELVEGYDFLKQILTVMGLKNHQEYLKQLIEKVTISDLLKDDRRLQFLFEHNQMDVYNQSDTNAKMGQSARYLRRKGLEMMDCLQEYIDDGEILKLMTGKKKRRKNSIKTIEFYRSIAKSCLMRVFKKTRNPYTKAAVLDDLIKLEDELYVSGMKKKLVIS